MDDKTKAELVKTHEAMIEAGGAGKEVFNRKARRAWAKAHHVAPPTRADVQAVIQADLHWWARLWRWIKQRVWKSPAQHL